MVVSRHGLESTFHGCGGLPGQVALSVEHSRRRKHLLIVYHTQTGHTRALAEAACQGAADELIEDVEVRLRQARAAGPEDLLWAHGLLLGTPENFGYMSGGMKDFLDRTFYPSRAASNPCPTPSSSALATTAAGRCEPFAASPAAIRSGKCRNRSSPAARWTLRIWKPAGNWA